MSEKRIKLTRPALAVCATAMLDIFDQSAVALAALGTGKPPIVDAKVLALCARAMLPAFSQAEGGKARRQAPHAQDEGAQLRPPVSRSNSPRRRKPNA